MLLFVLKLKWPKDKSIYDKEGGVEISFQSDMRACHVCHRSVPFIPTKVEMATRAFTI